MKITNILADGREGEIRGLIIRQTEHPEIYEMIERMKEGDRDGSSQGTLRRPG